MTTDANDHRLAVQLWLLTSAINHIEAQEPALHHKNETRAEWRTAKADVLELLREHMREWTQATTPVWRPFDGGEKIIAMRRRKPPKTPHAG